MSEQLKLENQLCFRLYNLNKVMSRLYAPLLNELNLTYPQYLVMLVLWQAKQSISVKAIGNKLNLDSGTLSPLLKRMEKLGIILRKRNEKDERIVKIYLTKQGQILQQKAECIPTTMLSQTGLAVDEIQALNDKLDQLLIKMSN
jgi:MarR family transcriptional regulator, organic hydroperoxide resistance regulator